MALCRPFVPTLSAWIVAFATCAGWPIACITILGAFALVAFAVALSPHERTVPRTEAQ